LPTFTEVFLSVSVLPLTIGWGGSTVWPVAGFCAFGPNSVGFAELNGNAATTASMPAIFVVEALVASSEMVLRVGPLIVERAEVRVATVVTGATVLARLLLRDDFLAGFFAMSFTPSEVFRLGVESSHHRMTG